VACLTSKTNKQMKTLNNKEQAILAIASAYQGISAKQIEALIQATNGIGGVSFVSLKGYSSDKSSNTEIANQLVNIGAAYKNMLTKDADIYANFDLSKVDIDKFNYETIDTGKLTLEQFKQAVKEALPIALSELNQPKAKKDTSADIWLNKALVFNLNTLRLSIFGQSINKVVETKGEFKVVKSAPKTIAKRLIEKQAKGKAQTLRRFALDNFDGHIKVSGDTIEIG
jgi:hypothetical protein